MKNPSRILFLIPALVLTAGLTALPVQASGPRACDIDGTPCDVPVNPPSPEPSAQATTDPNPTPLPKADRPSADPCVEKAQSAAAPSLAATPSPSPSPSLELSSPASSPMPTPTPCAVPAATTPPATTPHVGGGTVAFQKDASSARSSVAAAENQPAEQTTEQPSTVVNDSVPQEDFTPTDGRVSVTASNPHSAIAPASKAPSGSHEPSVVSLLTTVIMVAGGAVWKLATTMR